ncbi:MAG: hypothetical protein AAFR57_08950 [Pseudomonadota bacterium]
MTTAAGMAVAIPASAALSWFDSIADRLRLSMEDVAEAGIATAMPAAVVRSASQMPPASAAGSARVPVVSSA